ncbi:MAG: adenylate kinase, partial [Syntrophales bacterium]|nr:adenylate kinase [Syntrophales bacterium]
PNGSGKGTQGAIVQEKFGIPLIEAGVIFRKNISGGTELGKKASVYINKGDLVPDEITIPMILDRLQEADCKKGWMLDGFPRNITQAQTLEKALKNKSIKLDYVIEIVLDRETSKKRIMGRRLCPKDNNHPNNIHIDAIKPAMVNGKMVCRVCGAENLTARSDDQDEAAIDKRHDIYYDAKMGTMAAVNYFRALSKIIEVDGRPSVGEVSKMLMEKLP